MRGGRRGVPALVVAFAAACGGGGGSPTAPSASPSSSATAAPSPSQAPIFNQNVFHETRLDLDPHDWQALRDNYFANQYYAANLTIDGVSVLQIGIRSRGEGSRNELKPGLRLDMNRYVPTQEYYGYKTLVLDNLATDPSMLHERLTFAVFEAMGIPAPRNAFTALIVNGEFWGVYAIVESVSKPFLEARFGEKSGTLFDYEWAFTYRFSWLGPNTEAYVPSPFQPETNDDHPDVADALVAFIQTINEAPDSSFVAAMTPWLDVDRFLTHVAVENAVAEGDGILGAQGLNNFYLYQYGGQSRFVFIPWDKDSTFRAAAWPLYDGLDTNVLTRRLVEDAAKRRVYTDAVVRAVTSFVNPRWLTPRLETAYQQIRLSALTDNKKPYTTAEFETAVIDLRGVVAGREANVLAQAR